MTAGTRTLENQKAIEDRTQPETSDPRGPCVMYTRREVRSVHVDPLDQRRGPGRRSARVDEDSVPLARDQRCDTATRYDASSPEPDSVCSAPSSTRYHGRPTGVIRLVCHQKKTP